MVILYRGGRTELADNENCDSIPSIVDTINDTSHLTQLVFVVHAYSSLGLPYIPRLESFQMLFPESSNMAPGSVSEPRSIHRSSLYTVKNHT